MERTRLVGQEAMQNMVNDLILDHLKIIQHTHKGIVAALFERREEAIAFWNGLLEQGVYVNMILPPAAPEGGSLLRCSVSAAHTEEQIDRISHAFESLRGS